MIEIKIPKEITDYKEKFLFGLTVRQLVSAVVALAICVPLFIFGKDYLGEDMVGFGAGYHSLRTRLRQVHF